MTRPLLIALALLLSGCFDNVPPPPMKPQPEAPTTRPEGPLNPPMAPPKWNV